MLKSGYPTLDQCPNKPANEPKGDQPEAKRQKNEFLTKQASTILVYWCYFPSAADGRVSKRKAIFCLPRTLFSIRVDKKISKLEAIFRPPLTKKYTT